MDMNQRLSNFNKLMKKHYREVLDSAEEYEKCLNPNYPKDLLAEEISWMSFSTLNLFSYIDIKPGEKILDIGCGAGADCFIAAKLVGDLGEVIGVDPVEDLIKKARYLKEKYNFKNVDFIINSAENISFKDNYFKFILMNYSFHLIKEKYKVLKKVYNMLVENGKIIIGDSFESKEINFEEEPYNWFYKAGGSISIDKFKKIASEIGFKNIKYIEEKNLDEEEQIGYLILEKSTHFT